jgi:hypothetical protein
LSAKDTKKKEDLKTFTVGSVPPTGAGKAKKAAAARKVEISEKQYPNLAGLIKGNGLDAFKKEVSRVLSHMQELEKSDKAAADKIQKAYGMALAILENGKVVQ